MRTVRSKFIRGFFSLALAVLVGLGLGQSLATAVPPTPTIVLVHGAFADTHSWDAVADELRGLGYPVVTPDNPLRGPRNDAAVVRAVVDSIPGPVILVGHSYGGAVITNAARTAPNVKALVYIAAFAPAQGEPGIIDIDPIRFPGSQLIPPVLLPKIVADPQGPAGRNVDFYINPANFHDAFAADVPDAKAAQMAATQHSVAAGAFLEPNGSPAYEVLPSWWLLPDGDHAIPPAAQRFMADRAHSQVTEIAGSHAILVSRPDAVSALVQQADAGTR